MNRTVTETAGWYGVVAVLAAYVLLNFGMLRAEDPWYLFLNATGAIGIAVDAYQQKNWQPLVLNLVWFAVAVIALFRL